MLVQSLPVARITLMRLRLPLALHSNRHLQMLQNCHCISVSASWAPPLGCAGSVLYSVSNGLHQMSPFARQVLLLITITKLHSTRMHLSYQTGGS